MGARGAGITGVPCFILDARVAVPGAVEPDVFLRVLEEHGIAAAADTS
jgi:predicted DsbA family dithiol-disulfide isomerase